MGEDSDPKSGSDAVDDPRDDESERSGGRAPTDDGADDPDADSRSDDAADGAAGADDPDADSDGTETATNGEDDSTVARMDLDADAGSDASDDAETPGDAESNPAEETTDDETAVADPVAVDDASLDERDDARSDESAIAEAGVEPEPVAEAVPDPGAPDDASSDRTADADPDPVSAPDPDVSDGPEPDSPVDGADDVYGPLPAEDEAEMPAAADADVDGGTTAEVGSEADLTPVTDDAVDYPGFEDEAYDDDVGDGIVGEGPAEDEEMPLADHIEEMIRRLGVVFLIGGVVLIAAFPAADRIINVLWNAHIPGAADPTSPRRPRLYGPLELLLTELKVAGLAGFIVGLPALVYQSYRFMRPGLYPKERRYYLASVPTSLVLALVGVAFAHFIVLPAIFAYFTSYTANADIVVAFGLRETFNLILLLMGYMALVFQIPLFMMLAIMMGLVTRRWMTEKRLLFWGAFLGVSFLISPDPTGMTPIIVAATMIGLFEGTLLLIKWTTDR